MSHSTPDPDDVNASDAKVPTPAHGEPPLFTLLAGLATVTCLFTPRITLMLPVMAAVGCGVAAYVKHERGQKAGLIAAALAIVLLFVSSYQLSAPSWSNLGAAKIVATHWSPDPAFAGYGAIKWNVEVRNLTDRPIARVKVEIVTHDAAGNLLASDITFVDAILSGGAGTGEGYADYYGAEATANSRITEVHFAQ